MHSARHLRWGQAPCQQRDGGADGVGTVWRIDWSTRLPYGIVIEVEDVESVRHQRPQP